MKRSSIFKKNHLVFATVLAGMLAAPALQAASSKFSATIIQDPHEGTAFLSAATENAGTPITSTIRTASKKDLLIGVSMEVNLFTRTKVKGKAGETDSSMANAGVTVTVLVDGEEAYPGLVVFNQRKQDLSATFGGVLESCTDADADGTITLDECEFTDEDIELALQTMSAHHFNFILPDMEPGDHSIEVVTAIHTSSDGDATAEAFVGKCSLTVQEVQAINQDGGIVILD